MRSQGRNRFRKHERNLAERKKDLWKFWRDTRLHFFFFLTLLVGGSIAVALSAIAVYDKETGWSLVRGGTPERVAFVWRGAIVGLGFFGMLLAHLSGL